MSDFWCDQVNVSHKTFWCVVILYSAFKSELNVIRCKF